MSFAWIIVSLSLGSFLMKFKEFPSLLHSEVFACLKHIYPIKPMISGHLWSHLWSCIATSLYASEVIILYFTNIDNLYTSLYFTIFVLQTLQL